ncbi:MAG: lmo0937 family membrane protein [Candidatus Acidiferrales bacterium]
MKLKTPKCSQRNRRWPSVRLICCYYRFLTRTKRESAQFGKTKSQRSRAQRQGDEDMLGILAAILIVLWLLGFFAFHVTTAFIHIVLVVGLILLVLHFMRRRTARV